MGKNAINVGQQFLFYTEYVCNLHFPKCLVL